MNQADFSETIEHLNNDHNDTVLFIGRTLGSPEASQAAIVEIDLGGIVLDLNLPTGNDHRRIDFDERAGSAEDVRDKLLGLVSNARTIAGGDDLTSIEVELDPTAIKTFVATVAGKRRISESIVQVTVRSKSLQRFRSLGPDDFVHVLIPPAGRRELTIGEYFSWAAFAEMDPDLRPRGAYYTVKEWRPSGEVDMWFVLHGDDGPLSCWAKNAEPGDPVALWGPRTSFEPPESSTTWILTADETGLPALLNILSAAPEGVAVHAFVETGSAADHLDVATRVGHRLEWLHRDGQSAGSTNGLLDAVRTLGPDATSTYAWGGAESRVMTAVRRYLRDDCGFERDQVAMIAYWRTA